ncbi:hypothetical protein ACFZB9_36160 [Kitasatospora sp. NPDC008050]|uniref:hypothetical protein n=1 Tax=Kitasatospora sp. NPDC008050 TaxID=3364021 RepID=UPI0036ECC358
MDLGGGPSGGGLRFGEFTAALFDALFACPGVGVRLAGGGVGGAGDVDDVPGPHAGEVLQVGGGVFVTFERVAGGVGLGKGLGGGREDVAGHTGEGLAQRVGGRGRGDVAQQCGVADLTQA